MTVTESLAPVRITRTVLVGIEDLPDQEVPAPPVRPEPDLAFTTAALDPPPAPVVVDRPRFRLAAAVASVALLLVSVAVMGWFRFASPQRLPTPAPTVAISATPDLAGGDPVLVDLGPGGGEVRVDLFVDGDWTGVDTTAPYTPYWEHRSPGVHELKAKVTDADGNVRYSEPALVEVPD